MNYLLLLTRTYRYSCLHVCVGILKSEMINHNWVTMSASYLIMHLGSTGGTSSPLNNVLSILITHCWLLNISVVILWSKFVFTTRLQWLYNTPTGNMGNLSGVLLHKNKLTNLKFKQINNISTATGESLLK